MDLQLTAKTALVTGASRGIGLPSCAWPATPPAAGTWHRP